MRGITLNGFKLHEVEMLLEPYKFNVISRLSYPKSRIKFEKSGSRLNIKIPGFLALELYRSGIISPNQEHPISVRISGNRQGDFKIVDFRYPNTSIQNFETITITMECIN